MKIFIKILVISLIPLLTNCASTSAQANADHGPFPQGWQQSIEVYLDRNLKDPDSLKDFRIIGGPFKGFVNYGAFERGPTGKNFSNPMWYVCIEYRAKNSFGAYTGLQTQAVFFYDGRIERVLNGKSGGGDLGNTVFSCY